ncbi:MAG: MBL fold metallo-hydrolase [Chloroflexi bacterium]|nr:MAG: MBL fold metallo-hydrolase [Chloroflexota bacterium]
MLDSLQQIADSIWIFPQDARRAEANVGVICTAHQTILVDAGNGPRHARRIALALMEIDAPPVSHLIYTHHHWDHTFGGMMFDVPAIAHESCFRLLQEMSRKPWSQTFLREEIFKNPLLTDSYNAIDRAIGEWRHFRIRLPTMSFSRYLQLYIDDMALECQHVGGQHAPDSIVVQVPQAGVMFLGDCFYPPPAHLQSIVTEPDYAMLRSLLVDSQFEIFIAGHSAPHTRQELETFLEEADEK